MEQAPACQRRHRDPSGRTGSRRRRRRPSSQTHHRTIPRHRQGSHPRRTHRGLGRRAAARWDDAPPLRGLRRFHHPFQWRRPTDRRLSQPRGPRRLAGRSLPAHAADLRSGWDVRGAGQSPDRCSECPVRPRGVGAGVDVPRRAGHPSSVVPLSSSLPGHAALQTASRAPWRPKRACSMRPASWHLARGEVDAGVEYLLRARNWDGALDVIMGQGSEVFERGEMATVIRWITAVPELARAGSPGGQPPPRDPQWPSKGTRRGQRTFSGGWPRIPRPPTKSAPAPRCSLPPWCSGGPGRTSPSTWRSAPSTNWSASTARRCPPS